MRSALKLLFTAIVLAVLGVGIYYFYQRSQTPPVPIPAPTATTTAFTREVIGKSVEGRELEAYTYGKGPHHLLFVGGMHGGYEWNSVLLARQMMTYLEAPQNVPSQLTVTIIPSINPDGVYKATGKVGAFAAADATTSASVLASARFNAHGVDLNRNFDCKWQPESTWRSQKVSAGTAAFSEPEAAAIRDWVFKNKPEAAIFWHSQANAVYASECLNGILPETLKIMNLYAGAAGYPSVSSFDAYPVTGDVEGWLASINIPAITVELSTHETVEWDRNLAGTKALLQHYQNATSSTSSTVIKTN
jgi:predicted deacylase